MDTLIRYGNDINATWSVYGRNGLKYGLTGKIEHLWLVNGPRKKEISSYSIQARNQLVFLIDKGDLNRLGAYKLVLRISEADSLVDEAAYDLTQVFQIVAETYPMTANGAVNGQCDVSFTSILKNVYVSDLEGKSAYEIAVLNGFEGTEAEWLESLIGIRSVEQTRRSSESGGTNTITFTLADGSTVDVDILNGSRGEAAPSALSGLSDVNLSPLTAGQVLKWNGSRWVNGAGAEYSYGSGVKISAGNVISADIPQIAAGLIAAGYDLSGGGSGSPVVTALSGLSDVSLVNPVDGQVLAYDASISRWVAKTISSGGGGGGGGQDLSGYVTIAGAQTITGQKSFGAQVILADSLIVGSGAATLGQRAPGAKKRIYFGDADHYIELNSKGYFFYGGGIYTNSFVSGAGLSGSGGGGGQGVTALGALTDVSLGSLTAGDSLVYDPTAREGEGAWVNKALGLGDLANVNTSLATEGQALIYNGASWEPRTIGGTGGGGPEKVFFGTCANSSGVAAKVVTCPEFTSSDLVEGTVIHVVMTNDNSISNPTLNVNQTGAKTIIYPYSKVWDAGELVTFVYYNGCWKMSTTGASMSGGGSGGGGTTYSAGVGLALSGTTFNVTPATTSALGGVKVSASVGGEIQPTVADSGVYYAVGIDSANKLHVRIPTATDSVYGMVKMATQARPDSPAMITGGTTGNRYYGVEMNSSGQLFVNVPWIEGTDPAGSYLPLGGGTMNGTINAQEILPKVAGKVNIGQTGLMTGLDNGYDLGSSAMPFRSLNTKVIYLGREGNEDVYIYYDTVNKCVRVHGAGVASDSFIAGTGTLSN